MKSLNESAAEQPKLSFASLREPPLTPEMKEKIAAWKKMVEPIYKRVGTNKKGESYDYRVYPPLPETTERWQAELRQIEQLLTENDHEQIYAAFASVPLPEKLEHLRTQVPRGIIQRMSDPRYNPEVHGVLLATFMWFWFKREPNPPVADYAAKIYEGEQTTLEESYASEYINCIDRCAVQSLILSQRNIPHDIFQPKEEDPHVIVRLNNGVQLDFGAGVRDGGMFFSEKNRAWAYKKSTIVDKTKRLLRKAGVEGIANFFRRFL